VLLIDDEGKKQGIIATKKAIQLAEEKGLDLVVVSASQSPPVAKIMDYGKYRYEMEKRAKEAKKKQKTIELKEIKIRYKIDVHDYNVRIKSAKKFLQGGDKVKVVVVLRGREAQHSELAFDLAKRFLNDMEGEAMVVEKQPTFEGRNIILVLAPSSV